MKPFFEPWPEVQGLRAAFFGKEAQAADVETWIGPGIPIARLNQVHSSKIIEIADPAQPRSEGDALFTKLKGVSLWIFTADCLPLLAFGGGIVGACHGGWRGLSSGIIENWISAMVGAGADRGELRVAVGPGIGKCHFEVGKDVAETILKHVPVKFLEVFKSSHPDPQKDYIDLSALARFKLMSLGVDPQNVILSRECTYCEAGTLPSYRREGKNAGRIRAVIVNSAR